MSRLLQSLTFWCPNGPRTIKSWTLTCNRQSHPHKWLHFDTNVEHNNWHLYGSSDRTIQVRRYRCSYCRHSAHSVLRWHTAVDRTQSRQIYASRNMPLCVQKWNRFILYGNILDWTETGQKCNHYFTTQPLIISCSWLPENELHYSHMTHSWILIHCFIPGALSIPRSIYILSNKTRSMVIEG